MDTDTDTDMDTDIDTNTDTGTEIDTDTDTDTDADAHAHTTTHVHLLARFHARTHARNARTDNTRHEAHPSQLGVLHAAGPNMVRGKAHLYLSSMNVRNNGKQLASKTVGSKERKTVGLAPKKEHLSVLSGSNRC